MWLMRLCRACMKSEEHEYRFPKCTYIKMAKEKEKSEDRMDAVKFKWVHKGKLGRIIDVLDKSGFYRLRQ